MSKPQILIVEDDPDFQESLRLLLENDYNLQIVDNGLVGLKSALRNPPDLILTDLKMPEMDGFETCKILRRDAEFNGIPIIVVSGYNTVEDRTRAFAAGADDFIAKPFNNSEFLARLQRKLNQSAPEIKTSDETADVIECGNLKLLQLRREAFVNGQPLQLSNVEFLLLQALASKCGQLISRKELIRKVWNGEKVSDRIVDPHFVAIRNKLIGCDHTVVAVYGKGYILKRF